MGCKNCKLICNHPDPPPKNTPEREVWDLQYETVCCCFVVENPMGEDYPVRYFGIPLYHRFEHSSTTENTTGTASTENTGTTGSAVSSEVTGVISSDVVGSSSAFLGSTAAAGNKGAGDK